MVKSMIIFLICNISSMQSQSPLKTVNFEELGVSFTIPMGWNSQIDGDYMILKHPTISAILIVFESRSTSVNTLIEKANHGITEEGVKLTSLNDFKAITEYQVEGHYEGIFLATLVKAIAIGIINGTGSGLTVLAIAEPNNFNDVIKNEAQKLIASVRFKTKNVSKQTKFWIDRCVGKRLNYFNTRTSSNFDGSISGLSDREAIDLFNDGSFYYHTKNQSIVNSEQMNMGNNVSGEYRIISVNQLTYLQLFSKGETIEFELSLSPENYTLLNGMRYALQDLED